MAENTIVVMMSDHGDLLGAHGLFSNDISAFEEVYRLPFIVSGPGVAEGTRAERGLHPYTLLAVAVAGKTNSMVVVSASLAVSVNASVYSTLSA